MTEALNKRQKWIAAFITSLLFPLTSRPALFVWILVSEKEKFPATAPNRLIQLALSSTGFQFWIYGIVGLIFLLPILVPVHYLTIPDQGPIWRAVIRSGITIMMLLAALAAFASGIKLFL